MHITRGASAAVIALALGLNAFACDNETLTVCTLVGCDEQLLALTFKSDQGPLPLGSYAIALALGGSGCTINVDHDGTDKEIPAEGCAPGSRVVVSANQFDLALLATPAEVDVTMTRDGQSVADLLLQPTYEEIRPNGPACEPVCKQGTAEVTVQ